MEVEKKPMPKYMQLIGKWAFIAGIAISVIAGIYAGFSGKDMANIIISILALLGLIIGLINITPKETMRFIIAVSSVFLIMSLGGDFLKSVDPVGPFIDGIIRAMMVLFIPALIIVALKTMWDYSVDV